VDLLRAPHVHVRTPLNDLRMFANGYADLVYASHCLEHFGFREVPLVLAEWVRVLKPGGILRIAVPDFQVIAKAYAAGVPLSELRGYILGEQNYGLNKHLAAFDEPMLRGHLEYAGLKRVRRWSPDSVADHDFVDDSGHLIRSRGFEELVSLNLEADKPVGAGTGP
jgi:ubiquinone/menaquinone biosynthesis C-methylase UbiE